MTTATAPARAPRHARKGDVISLDGEYVSLFEDTPTLAEELRTSFFVVLDARGRSELLVGFKGDTARTRTIHRDDVGRLHGETTLPAFWAIPD